MEPIPVRAIPVEELPLAAVDAEAADAAVVGTARFAMWVGGTIAVTCGAMAHSYYGLSHSSSPVRTTNLWLQLVFLCVQVVGGLALAVGGFGAKRFRAAGALMAGGSVAILAAYLVGLGVSIFETAVRWRTLGVNAMIFVGSWLQLGEAMLAPLGALLLAYCIRTVRRAQILRD